MNFIFSKHYTLIYIRYEMKSIFFSDVQTRVPNLLFLSAPHPHKWGPRHYPGYTLGAMKNPIKLMIKVFPKMPWGSLSMSGPHIPITYLRCREGDHYALIWDLRFTTPEIHPIDK